jgi:hypothetical protein
MEQSLNERRQLLQTKIFAHSSVTDFNSYSRGRIKQTKPLPYSCYWRAPLQVQQSKLPPPALPVP